MKKIITVVLIAFLIGGCFAVYIFNKIDNNGNKKVGVSSINGFQIGVYTNYDNAKTIADRNNGIIINDNNYYRVYVSFLNDTEAIEKLSNYYNRIGLSFYLKQVTVNDDFKKEINIYEELLKKSSSDTYSTINQDILKLYEEYL